MTADRLAEIRARVDAATEGPWFDSVGGLHVYGATPGDEVAQFRRGVDATFARRAREDVPWLLAEVERLRRGRDIWRADRDRLAATVARVRALADEWEAYGDNAMKSAIARQGMGDEQELRRYAGLMWQRSRDLTAAIEGTDS